MGATLQIANDKGAYTISDRGTYLATESARDLEILVEGGTELLNVYHVIDIATEAGERVNAEGGKALADWLVSPAAQDEIETLRRRAIRRAAVRARTPARPTRRSWRPPEVDVLWDALARGASGCCCPATRRPGRSSAARCASRSRRPRWRCCSGCRRRRASPSGASADARLALAVVNTGMGVPPVVAGLVVTVMLWRSGPFGALGLLYTPTAMVIAQTAIALPLVAGFSDGGAAACRSGLPAADAGARRRAAAARCGPSPSRRDSRSLAAEHGRLRRRHLRGRRGADGRWEHRRRDARAHHRGRA